MGYFKTVKQHGGMLALFSLLMFSTTMGLKLATGMDNKQWVADVFGPNPMVGALGVAVSAAIFTFLLFSFIMWAGDE